MTGYTVGVTIRGLNYSLNVAMIILSSKRVRLFRPVTNCVKFIIHLSGLGKGSIIIIKINKKN